MIRGEVPAGVCQYLYGGRLFGLLKKDGSISLVAVSNTVRRLAGKVINRGVPGRVKEVLRPVQIGYGTKGGAEAIVHAVRAFIK